MDHRVSLCFSLDAILFSRSPAAFFPFLSWQNVAIHSYETAYSLSHRNELQRFPVGIILVLRRLSHTLSGSRIPEDLSSDNRWKLDLNSQLIDWNLTQNLTSKFLGLLSHVTNII